MRAAFHAAPARRQLWWIIKIHAGWPCACSVHYNLCCKHWYLCCMLFIYFVYMAGWWKCGVHINISISFKRRLELSKLSHGWNAWLPKILYIKTKFCKKNIFKSFFLIHHIKNIIFYIFCNICIFFLLLKDLSQGCQSCTAWMKKIFTLFYNS